jgi:hypothetical protein
VLVFAEADELMVGSVWRGIVEAGASNKRTGRERRSRITGKKENRGFMMGFQAVRGGVVVNI